MTDTEKEDIKVLLDYMWRDEEAHYQSAPSNKHIFIILKRLAKKIGHEVAERT